MFRLTLLLCFGMFVALMTLGTDQGQLRPGLALAASEGRLDEVWDEARAAAEPAVAPQLPAAATEAETVLAQAEAAIPQVAQATAASSDTLVEIVPSDTVVLVVEEPVFTLSALGNELVPGEDGTPIDAAVLDVPEAAEVAEAIDPFAVSEPVLPEALAGGQGTIWYVSASSVNVRSAPNTDAEVLGKLGSGEAALMVAAIDGQWARIVIQGDGLEGYVALRYLTPEAP